MLTARLLSASPPAPARSRLRTKEVKQPQVIVAVDFGTTFSGVAFANTDEPEKKTILKEWGRGAQTANKVPTILQYGNDGTFKWGFEIRKRPTDRVHEWFKLGLCPEDEGRRAAESELQRMYPSSTALPAVKGEEAEKLVVDYLSGLRKRVDEHFKASFDSLVGGIPRHYIVTVPAIWDHKEQDRTRSCAEKAGMGKGTSLHVVSEPEAAAIYALERMPKLGLEKGDTFIICDAGGGTVDLTSYKVTSLDPINLAGVAKGSGGLCGGSFLNRIFEAYLRGKFEGYTGGWDDGCLRYCVEMFEGAIKPEFTGDDDPPFSIILHGLADSPSRGLRGGYLELTGKELRENVFDKVITKIQVLVRDQISNTGEVKAVLLAGGFGQSSYLKQQLEQLSAVKDKGIKVHRIENRHLEPAEADLIARMTWFVKEGDSIRDRAPKKFPFEKEQLVVHGRIDKIDINIYTCEKRDTGGVADPKYPDDLGVKKCASVQVDVSGTDFPVETRNNEKVYVAGLEVEMTLDSASLSFIGVCGEKRSKPRQVQFV